MQRFWLDMIVLGYATATGLVSAGIIASFYELVAARPARFGQLGEGVGAWLLSVLFFAMAGPFIVVRSGIRAAREERQRLGSLVGRFVIACLWSACSGLVVLDVALAARDSFG